MRTSSIAITGYHCGRKPTDGFDTTSLHQSLKRLLIVMEMYRNVIYHFFIYLRIILSVQWNSISVQCVRDLEMINTRDDWDGRFCFP